MTHPNEYPGKSFIPHEGDMMVETVAMPDDYSDGREGVFGVTPEERQAPEAKSTPYWVDGDKMGFGIGEEPDGRP